MELHPEQPLVDPLSNPVLTLRRQMLVSGLFKYVAEVEEIDGGYAFRFRRSELLARRIADYILFEGQNSPQLTFVIVAESNGGALWLQVRGSGSEKDKIRTTCVPLLTRMHSPG